MLMHCNHGFNDVQSAFAPSTSSHEQGSGVGPREPCQPLLLRKSTAGDHTSIRRISEALHRLGATVVANQIDR